MRIRIFTKECNELREEIRERAHKGEWSTWETIDVGSKNLKRLIHVPSDDDQYRDIQLRLLNPSDEDIKAGVLYLDILPSVAAGSKLTLKQRREKKAIVLGRFCEILNRYFPNLNGYRVILKEK